MSAKIIQFPIQATAPVPAKTKRLEFHTAEQVREMLREIGVKASKATVKVGCSISYITITVRDHTCLKRVRQLASKLHSWSMGMDDCASGQAVTVELSDKAKEAMAAPFIEAVMKMADNIPGMNQAYEVSSGILLWHTSQGLHLETRRSHVRRPYMWTSNLANREDWAISRLALDLAELTEVVADEQSSAAA